jgi:hypothetical protein
VVTLTSRHCCQGSSRLWCGACRHWLSSTSET